MITQYLPSIRRVARLVLKYGARSEIARLKNSSLGGELGLAFDFALSPSYLPGEQEVIGAIEQVRSDMNESKALFPMIDFGAGKNGELVDSAARSGYSAYRKIGELSIESSADPFWARLLFGIIRQTKPRRCLEMGGLVGVSSSYQAAALRENDRIDANNPRLEILEGDPTLAGIIRDNLALLSLDAYATVRTGPFSTTLPEILSEGPLIDFAFVDGHHDGQATLKYFDQLRPKLSPSAIVVFDDIRWSGDMHSAWKTIMNQSDVALVVSTRQFGIVRMGESRIEDSNRGRYNVQLV